MQSTIINLVLIILAAYPDVVIAQSAGGSNSINFLTVLVAWLFSTVTTCIILGIIWAVRYCKVKKKKKENLKRNDSLRISSSTTRTSLGVVPERVPEGDTRYGRQESVASNKPLMAGGEGIMYRGIPRENSREAPLNRRRTGDFAARWCSDHGLPEGTASILREHGFLTQETIESLRPEDVPTLCLPTKGQECQLRQVLEAIQRPAQGKNTEAAPVQKLKTGKPRNIRKRSTSDHDILGSTGQIQNGTPTPNTPLLDRSRSVHDLEDSGDPPAAYPGTRVRKDLDDLDDTHMSRQGHRGVILKAPRQTDHSGLYLRAIDQGNPKGFNGLLSNAGLYEMAGMLGAEWPHLATILGIPPPLQDQIRMDYPSNTKQQIYQMLRLWRDGDRGSKELLKGTLHTALLRVHRTDLAEKLMMEQVDGSDEHMVKQKMTSLL